MKTNNKISTFGMLTKNRPEALHRGLNSYIKNCKKYGHTNDYAVLDDSENPKARNSNRHLLKLLQKKHAVQILYGGLEEKTRFAKHLAAISGIPENIIDFALFDTYKLNFSIGTNRNAFLLHTVGDKVFLTDDDTVCLIADSQDLKKGTTFSPGKDPYQYRFFSTLQEIVQSEHFVERDILHQHNQFLGQNINHIDSLVKNEETNGAAIPKISDSNIIQKPDGKIIVTMNGLIGDCALGVPFGNWNVPWGPLLLRNQSRRRLIRTEFSYRSACTSRAISRVVDRVTVSDDAYFIGTFTGLDNRKILVPQLAVRGEDFIFGVVLRFCFNTDFYCHLPWAMLHLPVTKRQFWPNEILRGASGFDIAKVIINLIKSFRSESIENTPEERLTRLGKHFLELSALPMKDFENLVIHQATKANNVFIRTIRDRLKYYNESPVYWANDLKNYLALLEQAMSQKDFFIPFDFRLMYGFEESKKRMQKFIGDYGRLLTSWPEIVEAAKRLRTEGKRLATAV